ncbi:MAG: YopX family protein [Cetobacterium sp.]
MEIKFRAICKETGKVYNVNRMNFNKPKIMLEGSNITANKDKFHIVQYTNVKDMKGEEIYNGDLIMVGNSEKLLKVIFFEGKFSLLEDNTIWEGEGDYICLQYKYLDLDKTKHKTRVRSSYEEVNYENN